MTQLETLFCMVTAFYAFLLNPPEWKTGRESTRTRTVGTQVVLVVAGGLNKDYGRHLVSFCTSGPAPLD